MNVAEYSAEIIRELSGTLSQIDPAGGEKLADAILRAKQIFTAGAGRSGFMVRAFAMRLMHMGFVSHVVGETVTPNIEAGDLFVVGSGSGETASLAAMAAKAKSLGAFVALISIFPGSTIGRMADVVIAVPAPTPKVKSAAKSLQPLGSLFEQSLLLVLDALILRLMEKQGQDSDTMYGKHANLE
ncbi:MAG: 6-phospho-3-hexuloisomerase [Treponema sp.]|jgi:6-phospho-3-hexuloisomerase|nr:6-phospho-3-hexuloisomerase [Treponema sp.]